MLTSAKAHQVQIGVEQGLDVQSNAFSSVSVPVTDGRYRLIPVITLEQPESDFTYFLRYRPAYSAYFRTEGINGIDHYLRARSSYQFDARDTVQFDATFARVRGVRSTTFTDAAGQLEAVPTISGITQRFDSDLSLDHSFSSRLTGTLGFRYNRWDYSNSNSVDNQGYGVEGQLRFAPAQRWNVGVNLNGRYRTFDETALSPASFSTVLNANVLGWFRLTDRISLQASGGPAGIFTRQSEPGPRVVSRWSPVFYDPVLCPVGPCGRLWGSDPAMTATCGTSFGIPILAACLPTGTPVTTVPGFPDQVVTISVGPGQNLFGQESDSLTYFVNLGLVYRFRRGQLDASFMRNEDAVSGIGTSTIVNTGRVGFVYALSDFWSIRAQASYSVRESVAQQPTTQISAKVSAETATPGGPFLAEAGALVSGLARQGFRQELTAVDVRMVRRLTQRSHLQLIFQYYDNNQSRSAFGLTTNNGFERFSGGVYYVYEFDPYKL